jgi:hypothetical protein
MSQMKQSRRIFMGSFPSGFQGVAFVFWGFRGSSISESQIKTSPTKTEGQGMATAQYPLEI